MKKNCRKCNVDKEITEFFKKKSGKFGVAGRCKNCTTRDSHKWQRENIEKANKCKKEWKERNKNTEKYKAGCRKRRKAYRDLNKEKCLEKERERRKRLEKTDDFYIKRRAQNKLSRSILTGKITRPNKCTICNEFKKLDGHHTDYNKPLDVIWCCRSCHRKEHDKDNNDKNTRNL